ncbi:12294_t:CDS:2 [Entrophospora sp. SA101]|nr:12294_t:CDS:2 [Entrophospora sp. SA101]
MFGFEIILDKKDRTLPKPINNRPGYDMKYIMSLISHYYAYSDKRYKQLFDTERLYDTLSVIQPNETPQQWAIHLTRINDVKPRKSFHYSWQRFVEIVESEDLMQYHWDHECDKPKTDFGHARIIQNAWRNYKRPESLASQIWNAVRNDNTPNDKKFLGLTAREVKNPQTRDQFNLWIAENLAMYRHYPSMYNIFRGREYKEYYIPYDWIGDKKYQLNNRLYKHVVDLLRERGYRIVNSRPWYEMIKWADKPDKYLNNKNFVRIE